MIIVTGAAGFIGSQIALHLAPQDEPLILTDKQNAFKEQKYTRPIESKIRFIDAGDEFLKVLPTLKGISWIIHMGAITNTAETNLEALKKWNVDYSKAIWNYCCENQVNLIYASSAATYGDGTEGFTDDHRTISKLKPLNPYGRSKNDFDLFVLAQPRTPPLWYGLKFFNVYGPNESHKGRMASAVWHGYNEIKRTGAMTLFKSHSPLFKDGDQARDFIHVKDVLRVIDFLRTSKPASGIYNCGTGHAGTFMDLATNLFKTLAKPPKIKWIETPPEFRAAYQYRTEANMNKLRAAGYLEAFTPLSEGIHDYVSQLVSSGQ